VNDREVNFECRSAEKCKEVEKQANGLDVIE
jgi:hypothetical protein